MWGNFVVWCHLALCGLEAERREFDCLDCGVYKRQMQLKRNTLGIAKVFLVRYGLECGPSGGLSSPSSLLAAPIP